MNKVSFAKSLAAVHMIIITCCFPMTACSKVKAETKRNMKKKKTKVADDDAVGDCMHTIGDHIGG